MATFQLTEAEFIGGTQAMTWKRRTWLMYFIAFALIMISLILKGHGALAAIGIPLLSIIVLMTFVWLLVRYRMRKVYRETGTLHEPYTVTIDDQQLSYSFARGSYILPWTNVRQWKETPEFFLLFESSYYGRMLPKRALSEEEVATIRRNIVSKPRRP